MKDLIVPALVSIAVGLPALVFTIFQWSKTWGRESRQIAEHSMEATLREGQSVLNMKLEFANERLAVSDAEKKELEDENTALRAENFDLWGMYREAQKALVSLQNAQTLINETVRVEERRMTDDRDGTQDR